MPKRSKTNKSEAIRQVLAENPAAQTKEVVATLAAKGVEVRPNQVYFVKGRLAQRRVSKRHKAKREAQASQKTGSADPVTLIRKVKALAEEAGGLRNLHSLLSVLLE